MSEKKSAKIIVIGAGIAGLTAAWELKKAGLEVIVLEKENRIGGRMQTIQFEDALIDCGAQFLSNAYSIIPRLINECGLNAEFIKIDKEAAIVSGKNIAAIDPRKPWQLFSSGLFLFLEFLKFGFKQLKFNQRIKLRAINDITAWVSFDNKLADQWVSENFGSFVADKLTASVVNGFYFQSLNNSSASLAAAVAAFAAHKPDTMTLKNGIGSLSIKMAEKLNVRTGVTVTNIKENISGVAIETNLGLFEADYAIIAVPASQAKQLWSSEDPVINKLLNISYSSTILLSLLIDSDFILPKGFASVYGFIFKPEDNNLIAAITIENNKCITRKNKGFLLNIMLADKAAKNLINTSDGEIYKKILSELEGLFPEISQHLQAKKIFRWQNAMPYTPIGRGSLVKQYRELRAHNRRIWLAGDYLGFPWTDSAAETGLWAAKQIIQSIAFNPSVEEKIQLVSYNSQWGKIFQTESMRLKQSLSDKIIAIEHIGSTAIPGIKAKPIVDIMLGINNLNDLEQLIKGLIELGYDYFGEAGVTGRLYFRFRVQNNFNIAVCEYQGEIWQNNILFRDYLKTHSDVAKTYEALKQDAFVSGADTLLRYSELKSSFIEKIIKENG